MLPQEYFTNQLKLILHRSGDKSRNRASWANSSATGADAGELQVQLHCLADLCIFYMVSQGLHSVLLFASHLWLVAAQTSENWSIYVYRNLYRLHTGAVPALFAHKFELDRPAISRRSMRKRYGKLLCRG